MKEYIVDYVRVSNHSMIVAAADEFAAADLVKQMLNPDEYIESHTVPVEVVE